MLNYVQTDFWLITSRIAMYIQLRTLTFLNPCVCMPIYYSCSLITLIYVIGKISDAFDSIATRKVLKEVWIFRHQCVNFPFPIISIAIITASLLRVQLLRTFKFSWWSQPIEYIRQVNSFTFSVIEGGHAEYFSVILHSSPVLQVRL